MNMKVLIALIIGVCMVAAAGILAFGMMNSHDVVVINSTNGTNTTNHTNMTNNSTVEHVNSDGASQGASQSDVDQAYQDGRWAQLEAQYKAKGVDPSYEGSFAQAQGISEADYKADMLAHQ